MRAHLVQFDIQWESKPANRRRVEQLLADTQINAGDLIVLPEMFDTGFSFNTAATADQDGGTLEFLLGLAARTGATVHGSRTTIGADGRGRNMATVTASRGAGTGLLCEYAKIHPFSLGRPSESEHFAPGEEVLTYPWGDARVCPAICYDLRFPELFRRGLLAGAEVFAIGSNWPSTREFHRRTLSIARAIENQAFVLSVNRCGRDLSLEYPGGTLAISPRGEVLGQLEAQEAVLSVAIDLADLRRWRGVFPAWKDHRLLGSSPPIVGE
ncbi:MAG: carbon-nitrogen family hydrolase [Phycisphaerales bacterium]|nr:carbon-nitrogen family hydrolase [Phycisphaerales bacterium]